MLKLRFFHQMKEYTCGPASLKMVFDFFGEHLSEKKIAKIAKTGRNGTSHENIILTARREGFYCYVHENASINQIKHFIDLDLPVIVDYKEPDSDEGHYSVVIGYGKNGIIMNDPWNGRRFSIPNADFKKRWHDSMKNHSYNRWVLVLSRGSFDLGKQYNPIR